MIWHHILDRQPKNGEQIVQIESPYCGHYGMGMRKYVQYCRWEEMLNWYEKNNLSLPDFCWMYAKDFPFPKFKER